MGLLDGLLGQLGSNIDVANMAAKFGISEDVAENAIRTLAKAHAAPGDTVETAASQIGLPTDMLQQIIGQIGGEGSLGRFAQMLDQDGDGSPLNDIAGLAKGFLK